jgi:hypothetical protein
MGNLDFNSDFRSNNPLFRKWCQDLFVIHWNKKEKGYTYREIEKVVVL